MFTWGLGLVEDLNLVNVTWGIRIVHDLTLVYVYMGSRIRTGSSFR